VTKLQRAEQREEAEDNQTGHSAQGMPHGPLPPYAYPESYLPAGSMDDPSPEVPVSPSTPSDLSESDNEGSQPDQNARNTASSTLSQDQRENKHVKFSNDDPNAEKGHQHSAVQLLSAYDGAVRPGPTRTSSLLFQMIPYRPSAPTPSNFDTTDRLISAGPGGIPVQETDPRPAMTEATRSVRLLLDKWTTSGSASLSEILDNNADKKPQERWGSHSSLPSSILTEFLPSHDPHRYSQRLPSFDRSVPIYRPHLMPNDSSDDDLFCVFPEPLSNQYPDYPRRGYVPVTDVWKSSHTFDQRPARYIGDDMLHALRHMNGGIVYIKGNDLQQSHYVDGIQFHRFNLVPWRLNPSDSTYMWTDIGKGWVRRAALDLLGYSCIETPSGNFRISRDLAFVSDLAPVLSLYGVD